MATIGNRFTPAFAGRRPNEPTPAPPGPNVAFFSTSVTAGVARTSLGGDVTDAEIVLDWGDGTPREQVAAPWNAAHAYAAVGVYLIRAIAQRDGRESVNGVRVQVDEPAAAIPDPVADFEFIPAAPTTADSLAVDGSLSTPAEHIDRYEFQRLMPSGANSYDQPWDMGPQAAGNVVVQLVVVLADGRRSAPRQRAVVVTEAE